MTVSTISSVIDNINSRYIQGGLTEVGSIGLEWWSKYTFPTDDSDQVYIVESKYNHRPDLIANAFYSDFRLSWFICQYNNILDPFAEITTGTILYIPTMDRLQLMFNQKPGGTISLRQDRTTISSLVL